jgi:hypothetical protein
MLSLRLATAVLLAAFLPWTASRAQQRPVPFVGAGVASGTGDLSLDTGNGWLVFGGVDVPLSVTPGLALGLTASFARVPYHGAFGEATTIPSLFAEAAYLVGARSSSIAKPYLRAGAGVMVQRYDPGSTGFREQSEARPGVSAGAGLQLSVLGRAVFLGAHYVTNADAGFLAFHGGIAFPGRPAPAARP